jgi:hypothetical protein
MEEYADKEFWDRYADFVDESLQRHTTACYSLFADVSLWGSRPILDLGCGKCFEALKLFTVTTQYMGFDVDPGEPFSSYIGQEDQRKVFTLDYRKEIDTVITKANEYSPTTFVSLFSTEVMGSHEDNVQLYDKLFNEIPSIENGLVSGFFYDDERRNNEVVEEAGDLKSYQSISPFSINESSIYIERRLLMPAPSKLFGPNVVEVWKLLRRK